MLHVLERDIAFFIQHHHHLWSTSRLQYPIILQWLRCREPSTVSFFFFIVLPIQAITYFISAVTQQSSYWVLPPIFSHQILIAKYYKNQDNVIPSKVAHPQATMRHITQTEDIALLKTRQWVLILSFYFEITTLFLLYLKYPSIFF